MNLREINLKKDLAREKDEEHAARWLVTYCSLAITLVAVFMMLVSYSNVAGGKMKRYVQSMGTQKPFISSPQSGPVDQTETAIALLSRHAQESGYSGKVEIGRTKNGFKVIIPANMLFASESAAVKEDVDPLFRVVSSILIKGYFSMGIAGYTSDLPIKTQQFPSNWELSGARSVNILKHLQNNGRVPATRLASAGYGQYRPRVSGSSDEAREKNDRVEFLFVRQDAVEG